MQHELKIAPSYFQAVLDRDKNFEVRKDDRGFQKGDIVILREYDHDEFMEHRRYTGRELTATIGYVTAFEQKDGYVVFSLLSVKETITQPPFSEE